MWLILQRERCRQQRSKLYYNLCKKVVATLALYSSPIAQPPGSMIYYRLSVVCFCYWWKSISENLKYLSKFLYIPYLILNYNKLFRISFNPKFRLFKTSPMFVLVNIVSTVRVSFLVKTKAYLKCCIVLSRY